MNLLINGLDFRLGGREAGFRAGIAFGKTHEDQRENSGSSLQIQN